MGGYFDSDLSIGWLKKTIHEVPSACSRSPCRQRRAAIKNANVVQAKKSAFEDIFARWVFAIDPPAIVDYKLGEGDLRKSMSPLPYCALCHIW